MSLSAAHDKLKKAPGFAIQYFLVIFKLETVVPTNGGLLSQMKATSCEDGADDPMWFHMLGSALNWPCLISRMQAW